MSFPEHEILEFPQIREDIVHSLLETSSFLFNAKVQLHGHPPIREFKECPVNTVQKLRKYLKESELFSDDVDKCVELVQEIQCPDWKNTVTLKRIDESQHVLHTILVETNKRFKGEAMVRGHYG